MAEADDQGICETSTDSDRVSPVVCPIDDFEPIRGRRLPHPHASAVDTLNPAGSTARFKRITRVDRSPAMNCIETDQHFSEAETIQLPVEALPQV